MIYTKLILNDFISNFEKQIQENMGQDYYRTKIDMFVPQNKIYITRQLINLLQKHFDCKVKVEFRMNSFYAYLFPLLLPD